MGFIEDHFVIDLGSLWDQSVMFMGSFCYEFRISLGKDLGDGSVLNFVVISYLQYTRALVRNFHTRVLHIQGFEILQVPGN